MEHLYAYHFVGFVVVEDDSGRNFFGVDYGGIIEAQVQGVGLLIHVLVS